MESTIDTMKVYSKLIKFIMPIFVKNSVVYEISNYDDDDTHLINTNCLSFGFFGIL